MNPTQLSLFRATPGAMSVAEGIALFQVARSAEAGTFVELGTHSGKSAIAIASALNRYSELHLIDPDFKVDEQWIIRSTRGVAGITPILHRATSSDALPKIEGDFSFVFIDSGEHTYELCRAECDIITPRMNPGGVIAFHDLDSQFKGVRQCFGELIDSKQFEEIAIDWDEIVARVERDGLNAGNDSYHHPEIRNPRFLGALRKL